MEKVNKSKAMTKKERICHFLEKVANPTSLYVGRVRRTRRKKPNCSVSRETGYRGVGSRRDLTPRKEMPGRLFAEETTPRSKLAGRELGADLTPMPLLQSNPSLFQREVRRDLGIQGDFEISPNPSLEKRGISCQKQAISFQEPTTVNQQPDINALISSLKKTINHRPTTINATGGC